MTGRPDASSQDGRLGPSLGKADDADCALAIRIQQELLRAGWEYIDGDLDHWPFAPVSMQKASSTILLAVWSDVASAVIAEMWGLSEQLRGRYAGLLLIGNNPCQADGLERFFAAPRGMVAYVDAVRGVFRLRRRWVMDTQALAPLRKGNLRRLLEGREAAKSAKIDCRKALAEHMEELRSIRTFQEQAKVLGGRPLFTYVLMAACLVVFGVMAIAAGPSVLSDPSAKLLLNYGADYGPLVRAGQWWRIFTCSFLHVGVMHLLLNVLAMLYFGWILETYQGSWRTAFYYFFSVATASLVSIWWAPQQVSAGASGGLFGMLGATTAVLVRYWRVFPPTLRKSLRGWLGTVLIYNVVYIFHPRIDGAAHVGGFVGGLAIATIIARSPLKIDWPPFWTWGALAGLVVAVMIFGQYAVARVPTDAEVPGAANQVPRLPELVAMIEQIVSDQRDLDDLLPVKRLTALPGESRASRRAVAKRLENEVLPAMVADEKQDPERLYRIDRTPKTERFVRTLRRLQETRLAYYREVLDTLKKHPTSCPVLAVKSFRDLPPAPPTDHVILLESHYFLAQMQFDDAHAEARK